ncbi:MAG TPA: amidohydrolase family protein [Terriglobia bacterium]|nr:amidohydrolase family protein [Terriglobia bacterium]
MTNRRGWLQKIAAGVLAGGLRSPGASAATVSGHSPAPAEGCPLALKDYQPRSMLHVSENPVSRSRFPVIDVHTHLSFVAEHKNGVPLGEHMRFMAEPEDALRVMDRKNIRTMVDLTGGVGAGLESTVQKYQHAYPGRFVVFTEPWWERSDQPGYSQFQADQIERAHQAGAAGLKVLKVLGLYLRENVTTGPLVKVDDPRFDAMWEACGSLKMPVAIHTSDPEAFFLPIDRFNERYEELNAHPDWSFHGKDFPSNRELLEARNRVFARHPRTQFIALHVGGDAENLAAVSQWLDQLPNMHVDLAARIGELGRQPRASRAFFEKYQDRIIFGTDATPGGVETPQQTFGDKLYEIYYRFLETTDEYFDYAPAPVPPQGRWRIYGLGLPEPILRKVYYENAARLLGLTS